MACPRSLVSLDHFRNFVIKTKGVLKKLQGNVEASSIA